MPEAKKKTPKRVGKVTHYFDKIKVAVIKFSSPVKVGDTLLIEGGEVKLSQKVSSLEKDHEKVKTAKKGQSLGLKVRSQVRAGYRVFVK
ncbi:MAG: hypothetical protein Q8Q38_03240 [bacterium]|nr:hypothetical protein [bacterium]